MDVDGKPISLAKHNEVALPGQDIPLPDSRASGPHTTLGGAISSEAGEIYLQSATFPDGSWPASNGQNVPLSELHWYDHGKPHHHSNPHQHIFYYDWDQNAWRRGEPTP